MNARVLKAPSVVIEGDEESTSTAFTEAIAAAFAQGSEHGRNEATAGLEVDLSKLRSALATEAVSLRQAAAGAVRLDAAELVALASDLASWALEGVVSADPALLTASMASSFRAVAEESEVVLHVHPDVAAALDEPEAAGVDAIRADPDLARSDFRLVTDGAVVERRFADSMNELAPELISCLQESRRDA